MPNATNIALIPLLPLAAFVLLGLFGRKYLKGSAGLIGTALLLGSAALAFYTAYDYFFVYGKVDGVYQQFIPMKFTWLAFTKEMSIDMGLVIDPISVMMLVVVTLISLMVHIYSLGYLKGEERFSTYYAYLGLFTFSMLGLVLASNIFQIYIFWELVGLSSFLLIGFYYDKPSAVAASKKAFIVTRFADLGFLIGILVLSYCSGTFDFQTMISRLAEATDFALAISPLSVNVLDWASEVQRRLNEVGIVDSLQLGAMELASNVQAKAVIKGSVDVLGATQALVHGKKHVIEKVQIRFMRPKRLTVLLTNNGVARFDHEPSEDLLSIVRASLPL